jgi:hypothetical protein
MTKCVQVMHDQILNNDANGSILQVLLLLGSFIIISKRHEGIGIAQYSRVRSLSYTGLGKSFY